MKNATRVFADCPGITALKKPAPLSSHRQSREVRRGIDPIIDKQRGEPIGIIDLCSDQHGLADGGLNGAVETSVIAGPALAWKRLLRAPGVPRPFVVRIFPVAYSSVEAKQNFRMAFEPFHSGAQHGRIASCQSAGEWSANTIRSGIAAELRDIV